MAFLTIAAINVDIQTNPNPEESAPYEVGRSRRAFAGNLRTCMRSVKRVWVFTSALMTEAQITTLRTAAPHGSFRTCTGDALGGGAGFTCEVKYMRLPYEDKGPNTLNFQRTINIQLTEV